jgi:hypothetical protein
VLCTAQLHLVNLTMEEEIKMMFQLAQPEGWRNRICSFNFPRNEAEGGREDCCGSESFWYEIGLGAYSQLELDLELTLRNGSGDRSSRNDSPAFGGYLYNSISQSSGGRGVNKNISSSKSSSGKENIEAEDEIMVLDSIINEGTTYHSSLTSSSGLPVTPLPPNDLYLANLLRMSIDCPFPDIRKQASSILFLLKVTTITILFI